jgi:paraquat-inducible protein A
MKALISLAAILLGLGLVAPCLILRPGAGEYTNFILLVRPTFADLQTFSILSGIAALFKNGEYAISLLLAVFSVLFPLLKLCVLWQAVDEASTQYGDLHGPHPALSLVERLGKYSMLDVLVLALIVVAVKRLPGGSEAHLGFGTIAFAGSVAISMMVPWVLRRKSK